MTRRPVPILLFAVLAAARASAARVEVVVDAVPPANSSPLQAVAAPLAFPLSSLEPVVPAPGLQAQPVPSSPVSTLAPAIPSLETETASEPENAPGRASSFAGPTAAGAPAEKDVSAQSARFDGSAAAPADADAPSFWQRRILLPVLHRLPGKLGDEEERRRTRLTWDAYDADAADTVRADIASNHAVYAAARENGDSLVRFLEGPMGFVLAPNKEDVAVPRAERIAARYNRLIDGLIASGQVSPDQVLRVGRVFRGRGGKKIVLEIGAPVPSGFRPSPELMSFLEWQKTLASGFMTLGEPRRGVIGSDFTPFEHDLAHMAAFVQHPRYMAAVRDGLRSLLADPGFRETEKLRSRLFFTEEYLSVIKPEARERIERYLLLPKLKPGRDYRTVSEVKDYLKTLSEERVTRLVEDLLREYPKAVEHVGGASKDLITMAKTANGFDRHSLPSLYRILKGYGDHKEHRIAYLAYLEVGIDAFSRITPEEFAEQAMRPRIDRSSKVYKIMVSSELFPGFTGDAFEDP